MYHLARDAEAAKAESAAASAAVAALADAQRQHDAAIELLGEREERIEELLTDIAVRPSLCCACCAAPAHASCALPRRVYLPRCSGCGVTAGIKQQAWPVAPVCPSEDAHHAAARK